MLHTPRSPWIHRLGAAAPILFLPHVAFASVGAGAGLPYEETFSKIVTSLTGPWAWTVAVVCVLIFAWRTIERGGDLGGSTMAFLGPAFICTLLLGAKKLMGFFGQGAMLTGTTPLLALSAVFQLGVLIGMLTTAVFAWRQHRRHEQQLRLLVSVAHPKPTPALRPQAEQEGTGEV